jgi:hypothetical protein
VTPRCTCYSFDIDLLVAIVGILCVEIFRDLSRCRYTILSSRLCSHLHVDSLWFSYSKGSRTGRAYVQSHCSVLYILVLCQKFRKLHEIAHAAGKYQTRLTFPGREHTPNFVFTSFSKQRGKLSSTSSLNSSLNHPLEKTRSSSFIHQQQNMIL